MLLKLFWGVFLFLLGLLSINTAFSIFPDVQIDQQLLLALDGITIIVAGLIIFVQRILLRFHKTF